MVTFTKLINNRNERSVPLHCDSHVFTYLFIEKGKMIGDAIEIVTAGTIKETP